MEKEASKQVTNDGRLLVAVHPHPDPPRRITSASLLLGQRQIVIEHVGREYRLHLTAKGKLILTG